MVDGGFRGFLRGADAYGNSFLRIHGYFAARAARKVRITVPDTYGQKSRENNAVSQSFLKKIFSIWHETVTFPVFLPILTLGIFLFQERLLETLLIYYAVSSTAIWLLIIAHAVVTQKIDRFYPEVRP